MNFKNGDKYEGTFKGLRHGKGKDEFIQDKYVGNTKMVTHMVKVLTHGQMRQIHW